MPFQVRLVPRISTSLFTLNNKYTYTGKKIQQLTFRSFSGSSSSIGSSVSNPYMGSVGSVEKGEGVEGVESVESMESSPLSSSDGSVGTTEHKFIAGLENNHINQLRARTEDSKAEQARERAREREKGKEMGKGMGTTMTMEPEQFRAYNFSAGPAALPTEVMAKAQKEFMNWQGTGMSMMEMSHRDVDGPVQRSIMRATELLRELLDIPTETYDVFFAQGGAHGQFAALPLNLTKSSQDTATYVNTGFWSMRAMQEAGKYCQVKVGADSSKPEPKPEPKSEPETEVEAEPEPKSSPSPKSENAPYSSIPDVSTWDIDPNSKYVHICANETVHGLEFLEDPDLSGDSHSHSHSHSPPLVCDMTSTLLSRPVDISKYGVIYASAGKNLGPAGFTVVIARKDLVDRKEEDVRPDIPSVLSWKAMARSQPIPSIYNTPPTYLIYMCQLVLEDLKNRGGLQAMEERAIRLSSMLYDIIDSSNGFYSNHVNPAFRSRMNVPFRIANGDKQLEDKFTAEAAEIGLQQVFGHPLFGGQRITLYNGVQDDGVYEVAKFMKDFAKRYGVR